jgi:hypothetical protein
MTPREQLIAYLATLGALIVVLLSALIVASFAPAVMGKIEAFGLGTITGGLIGVLRIPAGRTPVATTQDGDVNVGETK